MTKLLQKAFDIAATLPDEEQDAVGAAVLEDIESERRWQAAFGGSLDKLEILAEKALADHRAGDSSALDLDKMK